MDSTPPWEAGRSPIHGDALLSVKPLGGVWIVREEGATSAEAYDRRVDAVGRARQLLRRRGGGRLRILRRDGLVEREYAVTMRGARPCH
jgi:hypothetical protein